MRFQFMLGEIVTGLRRNLSMTVSLVLVTAVSLLLLGIGVLTQMQVGQMKDYWYDRVQVSIFLCGQDSTGPSCADGEVTQAQKDQLLADLTSSSMQPYVEKVFYESKAEAFSHFSEQFKGSVLADNVTADDLPESYRVKLRDPSKYAVVQQTFAGRAGVDQVVDQHQFLDRLFSLMNAFKWMAWGIAGLTLASTVLLVATTIRLTAFTRRRETAIMRLVGASALVIQMPFILEGLIATFIGAALAGGILLAFTQFVVQGTLRSQLRSITDWVSVSDAVTILPVLFAVGLLIAGVSSFLSLRRYLKV